jgi:sialate O-acetylesterase
VVRDVVVGDVWVCSGQSNMEWPVRLAAHPEDEIAAADHPRLRLFTVKRRMADQAADDVTGSWARCAPGPVAGFSAVGYYFGRELLAKLDVPIGLVHASWGGTPAESWMRPAALEADEGFRPILERAIPKDSPVRPCVLFQGMIAPILPATLRGVIWYQGESNASRAVQYRTLFPALIRDWRDAFGAPELPFLFVQLANFGKPEPGPGESDWAELREAQAGALALPATGMAVAIDVGEADDIHPKNKQEVGRRLALAALRVAHGRDQASSGPVFDSMTIEGARVRLRFRNAGGGLVARGETLDGFTLAGEDRRFVRAEARIDGDTVIVESPQVPKPAAARYAWARNPAATLAGGDGLPAAPFRTDDWPVSTAGRR